MSDSQSLPKQLLQNLETADFVNFMKLMEKTELPDKFKLPAKRGFQLTEKRIKKKFLPPPPPARPHSETEHAVYDTELGLPGCAPSQLLHTCLLAEYGRLEKVLDFVATTKIISVVNILLLNPKHSSCWDDN